METAVIKGGENDFSAGNYGAANWVGALKHNRISHK